MSELKLVDYNNYPRLTYNGVPESRSDQPAARSQKPEASS